MAAKPLVRGPMTSVTTPGTYARRPMKTVSGVEVTTPSASERSIAAGAPPRRRPALTTRWWLDVLVLGVLYEIYKGIRASVGGSASTAQRNALDVIRAERTLGIFHEAALQRQLLSHPWFLQAADLYYGTVHFVAPVVVLVWLYRRDGARYRRWCLVLCFTTGLALIGFAWYPLAPPRLLPAAYHFIDTASRFGGEGILDSGSMKDLDNLYAAMPSLHIAWSTWCAFAVWPLLRRPLAKALAIAYPVLTLAVVVVTANHYVLDAVGGLATLGIAFTIVTVALRSVTLADVPARGVHGSDPAL
jgi:hypothetical protein